MNKEITNNEFNSLKEDEKNNIIKALHEAGEPDKIIELLSAVPLESLSNLLLSLLAASYNNPMIRQWKSWSLCRSKKEMQSGITDMVIHSFTKIFQ